MKLRNLSKSEIKEINAKTNSEYGIELISKKDLVQELSGEINYIKVNGNIDFFYYDEKIVPTLKLLLKNNFLKKIAIDMGAVKFVVSGADIMRPGIVEIDPEIKKDDFVSIIDINNKKPLAVGISLFSTSELKSMQSGKCIKNIHYIGDKIWNMK